MTTPTPEQAAAQVVDTIAAGFKKSNDQIMRFVMAKIQQQIDAATNGMIGTQAALLHINSIVRTVLEDLDSRAG